MAYKATIQYKDTWSRGEWREHSVVADSYSAAYDMALSHCSDCEHKSPIVVEI